MAVLPSDRVKSLHSQLSPFQFRCPTCGAASGKPCTYIRTPFNLNSGLVNKHTEKPHTSRIQIQGETARKIARRLELNQLRAFFRNHGHIFKEG